jgi:alpha-L-rhamnosidase/F5/8 type C domain
MLKGLNIKCFNHNDTTTHRFILRIFVVLLFVVSVVVVKAQQSQLEKDFLHPPKSAKPWVFWYWMNGNVSKEGIKADLEAMKQVGLGGAYLMFIKDTVNPSVYTPAVSQLSKPWFDLVAFAITEAKRLQLELCFHVSDGFALAGGPWITPQLSMQKVVWTKLNVNGGSTFSGALPQPETNENYYNDIAIYAYPTPNKSIESTQTLQPIVTTGNGVKADFLLKTNSKESFKTDSAAWIQYTFNKPFTCRSIITRTTGNNYQAHRLIVQTSNDGINFKPVTRLESPRHGWQDTDADITHSIPATTAKYFRFVYDKTGTEPGSEDLDNAKWKPTLKISGIELSNEPVINQYEGKNGMVWRISKNSNAAIIPDSLCVPLNQLINITAFYKNGKLNWQAPKGNWTIIRIGHTSTGHKNETAGGGKGLECDKFNPQAIKLQFNSWFNKIYECVDSNTAKEVIKLFHVDSWECSSQNWSPVFAAEFKKRRGYDLLTYLPLMAGVPIQSAQKSEEVLLDVRKTINELVTDVFYTTLHQLSSQKGLAFSAESVAPTMLSDGIQHYSKVDVPMGEFWNNSPTHDKPNDMLDAISGAHVYGKNIIQAEAFTTVRMNWAEHPGSLKTLGDRNYALGVNKMVLHVFTHNPFINNQPGVTLDGVGLYYQRNQTWFKQSKAWIDYMARCQALLQQGKPVADIAVFTGEELPRRAVLPDRLIASLPGIFGKERVDFEAKRLANEGQPMQQKPDGVSNSTNNYEAADWVNPLNGYAYDSFNPDPLMRLAKFENGRIVLPSGASYKLLVLLANAKMNPNNVISDASVKKIIALVKAGATVLMDKYYKKTFANNECLLTFNHNKKSYSIANFGKGRFVLTPYLNDNFILFQLEKDVEILNDNIQASSIAYTHRKLANADVYFISNQEAIEKQVRIAFRVAGKIPEIWNPVSGEMKTLQDWSVVDGKTQLSCYLPENGAVFVVFRQSTKLLEGEGETMRIGSIDFIDLNNNWQLHFDSTLGGPTQPQQLKKLINLATADNPQIKYYSGTVIYKNSFYLKRQREALLKLTDVYNIASVKVNGIDCGTIWTKPYELDISKAVKEGVNTIEIAVTNTWHSRLIGDHLLPENKRITFTTAPFRLEGKSLQPSGLVGDVRILAH